MAYTERFEDKSYHAIAGECSRWKNWKPSLPQDDYRKSFEVEYFKLTEKYTKLHLLLPVLLSDACSLLFSDRAYERHFMVKMWCLLDEYSHSTIHDNDDYPLKFIHEGGPVLIRIDSGNSWNSDSYAQEVGYRTGSADPSCGKGAKYVWTDDQYRYAILALRALGVHPQYHIETNLKYTHGHSNMRKSKTCGQLLPSIFLGQESLLHFVCWDQNVFGCTRCDAHVSASTFSSRLEDELTTAQIFTYVALAEHNRLAQGGLGRGSIKPSLLPALLAQLDTDRYRFEDFWRLIAKSPSQVHVGDAGNAWGMFKLKRLDWIRKGSGESVHWNQSRFDRVMEEMVSFKKERKQSLAKLDRVKEETSQGQAEEYDGQVNTEISGSAVSEDIEEPDDDIIEISGPYSFQNPFDNAHTTTSTKIKSKKRAIKTEDTDLEDDTKPVKKIKAENVD